MTTVVKPNNFSRYFLPLVASVFVLSQLQSQEITDEFIDSLYQREMHYDFVTVCRINYALKYVEELDTIVYSRIGENLVYSFNGEVIDGAFGYAGIGKPINIFTSSRHGPYYRISMHIEKVSEETGMERTVVYADHLSQYSKIVLKHYVNDVPDDLYLELTPLGERLVEGYYTQVDSVWQDTLTLIDPITYKITDSLVVRDKFAVKVGRWLYRNEEGDTIRIEEYPKLD